MLLLVIKNYTEHDYHVVVFYIRQNNKSVSGSQAKFLLTSCLVPSHFALLMESVVTSVQYIYRSLESQSRATAFRISASGMTSSNLSSVSKLIRRMSVLRAKSRNLSRPDQRPKVSCQFSRFEKFISIDKHLFHSQKCDHSERKMTNLVWIC